MRRLSLLIITALLCPLPLKAQPQTQPQTQPSAAPQTMPAVGGSWDIVPCSRFGPIQSNTSAVDLVKLFGRENVQDIQIEGPEGESYPGTVIFPNDPAKKLQIVWKDAAAKKSPVEITVSGEKTVWKTSNGLTLGTRLKDLEKLNGGPFTISGFGWDYGGRVVSWENGALTKLFPKTMGLMLDVPANPPPSEKDMKAVSGDKNFKTDNPVLQAVNPWVVEISCNFQ